MTEPTRGTPAGALARRPFFLVGAQRSGTTLLRLMLDHHPEVAVPHEFDFAVERISERGEWPAMEDYLSFLEHHGSFRRSRLHVDPSLSYPELMESFLRQRAGGKSHVGMAVHFHFERLLALWPRARFVHIVRDPRDVASSVVRMGWAGTVWHGVERWLHAERSWDLLCESTEAEDRLEVRFEDLVASPVDLLERVARFLGVAFDPAMLEYARDTTYAAPDPGSATTWRSRLGRREIQLVEARVGGLLEARGYARSGLPQIRPGAFRRGALALRDRCGRAAFRMRRHGVALYVLDGLARRLRIRPLARWARQHVRRNEERYIR